MDTLVGLDGLNQSHAGAPASAPAPAPAAAGAVRSVRVAVAEHLAALADRWPVGMRVRHAESGWVGTVTPDVCGEPPGFAVDGESAHCLLFEPPYGRRPAPAVVCVAWDHPAAVEVAWMRPERLRPAGDGGSVHGRSGEHRRGRRPAGDRRRTRTAHRAS
jgi:hypothetical protein